MNKAQYIIIHHVGASSNLEGVNSYHKSKGFPVSITGYYVGYHYFIKKDGNIVQTREENEVGAHTLKGFNYKSIGICLEGNFNLDLPTKAQQASLKRLVSDLKNKYDIPVKNIGPHRKFHQNHTSCFGTNLSDDWVQSLLVDKTKEKLVEDLNRKKQGVFVISVEENGELYVMGEGGQLEYLKKPEDMFNWVKKNALGISKENLKILLN